MKTAMFMVTDLDHLRLVTSRRKRYAHYVESEDAIYKFDPSENGADDNSTIIQPDDREGQDGRWILSISGIMGEEMGGGGPPGTWSKLQQDSTAITAGATVTLTSIAAPASPSMLLVAFVHLRGAGTNHLHQGTTAAAPNTASIAWDWVANGGNLDLKARGGAAITSDFLDWVVYQFTPE